MLEIANEGKIALTFIIAVPQCPSGSFWNMERDAVTALIAEITTNRRVDSSRIYAIGYSLGRQISKAARLKMRLFGPFMGREMRTDDKYGNCSRTTWRRCKINCLADRGYDIMKETLSNPELYIWLTEQRSRYAL
ncbi:hypothetical protein GK047_06385 [Paenibacillus sp. SYP-B3998]|uniref:Alpha/beta hydrolase n=1 Tax=Paenibacillus sp. SYP-B3998 TaxID=2678564 RepID=A0A6G3ZUC9_9BACL|nr:hypothetical protein [Paenibacillus sp. SYP-B3998]NEW05648.1 hypothetical protein [Paenibacillus sp. SYP-B3998]